MWMWMWMWLWMWMWHARRLRLVEQRRDHRDQLGRGLRREAEAVGPGEYVGVELLARPHAASVHEGRDAREQLVDDDTHRPPVGRRRVALSGEHLGRQVLGCAAAGVARALARAELLAQAEIDELEVAVLVEQQVGELEVT